MKKNLVLLHGALGAELQLLKLKQLHVFGYSMGGYVALYLAHTNPALVESVITLGTKLFWDEATAAKEVSMMQPERIEQKVPAFAENLNSLHYPNNWKEIMLSTADMLTDMGKENPLSPAAFENIKVPVLLMLGDSDKMEGLPETVHAFQQMPLAQLAVLPATPHALEQTDTALLPLYIDKFVTN